MVDRRPPRDCPVCGDTMALTRLSCGGCGTELSGAFDGCEFCSLGSEDREVLRVFLASRGNVKDVERHLGVSYPTARARVETVLSSLGFERANPSAAGERASVLSALADGQIDVEEALKRL